VCGRQAGYFLALNFGIQDFLYYFLATRHWLVPIFGNTSLGHYETAHFLVFIRSFFLI